MPFNFSFYGLESKSFVYNEEWFTIGIRIITFLIKDWSNS